MTWLVFAVAIIIAGAVFWPRAKRQDDSDVIYICRQCFESRYQNTWLGWRLQEGICQVCHQAKLVDRTPMDGWLRPKDDK
jgi:hypothetical protein